MNDRRRAPHPLSVLHILGMLVLLGWWGWYFWQHSPAREAMRRTPARASAHHAPAALDLRAGAGAKFEEGMARAATAMRAAVVDVGAGLVLLVLFGFGTGVYVRRLEIWLQARGSGAAMSLAGTGLSDKALAANADRGGMR